MLLTVVLTTPGIFKILNQTSGIPVMSLSQMNCVVIQITVKYIFQLALPMELCMQRVLPCIRLGSVTTVTVSEGINSACNHGAFWILRAAHLDTEHSPAAHHTTTAVSSVPWPTELIIFFVFYRLISNAFFEKLCNLYLCLFPCKALTADSIHFHKSTHMLQFKTWMEICKWR